MYYILSELKILHPDTGSYKHSWSSFLWEVARAIMGITGVPEVHYCGELFNLSLCFHHCYRAILHYVAGKLSVSNHQMSRSSL